MTALQSINQGTAPAGSDGDTVRSAFAKMNSNVAVLNVQAALTSVAPITAAQALTAAHIGKRVNINLASAGTINMAAASTCGADQVMLLRNVGSTVVTLAPAAESGDTVALSKLNPGETVLVDTDGAHAWNVLMRGRTNSDTETFNERPVFAGNVPWDSGNFTPSTKANLSGPNAFDTRPTFAGNTPWDSSNLPISRGDCYLGLSGSNLMLSRKNGTLLTIGGVPQVIPAAGVPLPPSGTVASTFYYIYAYMSAGVMALEYSTTAYATDTTTGLYIKSGDGTRTLVGAAYCINAGSWVDTELIIGVLSYFNRRSKVISGTNSGGASSTPAAWLALLAIAWNDEEVREIASGTGSLTLPNTTAIVSVRVDGAVVSPSQQNGIANAGYGFPVSPAWVGIISQGAMHDFDVYGAANGGATLSMSVSLMVSTRG